MTGALLGGSIATATAYIPPLDVVDAPTDVSGYGNSGAVANITTGKVVATPTGGVPSYTHAWTQVGSTPYTWVINSPTAATTDFTCNALGPGNTSEAVFKDTVTDSLGHTASAVVTAFANNGQPYDNRVDRGGQIQQ
jgi:hypothetical protein